MNVGKLQANFWQIHINALVKRYRLSRQTTVIGLTIIIFGTKYVLFGKSTDLSQTIIEWLGYDFYIKRLTSTKLSVSSCNWICSSQWMIIESNHIAMAPDRSSHNFFPRGCLLNNGWWEIRSISRAKPAKSIAYFIYDNVAYHFHQNVSKFSGLEIRWIEDAHHIEQLIIY